MNEIAFNKPSIIDVNSFDATEAQQIYFNVSGGDLFTKVLLTVTEREKPSIIFKRIEVDTQSDYFFLPANTLENNRDYAMTIQVGNGTAWSESSQSDYFSCYARPVLSINDINEDGTSIVSSRIYTFTGRYVQLHDPIRYYRYFIYHADGTIFYDSGNIYDTMISVQVTGLESETKYYIELEALSQSGIGNTTGRILFSVKYSSPGVESQMGIICDTMSGDVSIRVRVRNLRGAYYDYIDGVLYATDEDPIFVDHKDNDGIDTKWLSLSGTKAALFATSDETYDGFTVQLWFARIESKSPVEFAKIFCDADTVTLRIKGNYLEALCLFGGKETIYGIPIEATESSVNETVLVSIKDSCLELQYAQGRSIT